MPIYEYECVSCAKRTELLQRLSDAPLASCPECGEPVRKLLSAPAMQFKGSGWYVTDYAGKGKPKDAGKQEGGEKKTEGAKEGGEKGAAAGKEPASKSKPKTGSTASD